MIRSRKKRKKVAFENKVGKIILKGGSMCTAAAMFKLFGFYPDNRNKSNKIDAQYHYNKNTKLK